MLHFLLATLFGAITAYGLATRQSITPLSSSQIDAFTPYSYYATVAYCAPAQTLAWNCGGMSSIPSGFHQSQRTLANCNANPGFKPVASGGDGNAVQFCKSMRSLLYAL